MQSMWWFVVALILGVAEIFTLDLTLLMLAGGALAGGGAALMGAEVGLAAVVALVVSGLLLFALRPFLLRSLLARRPLEETNAAALVGKEAKTLTKITEDKGRIKLSGEVWSARTENDAEELAEGVEVVVLKIAGANAIVAAK